MARSRTGRPRAGPGGAGGAGSLLPTAAEAHRRGELDAAEQGYRRVLESDPRQPDALNLLGVLNIQRGRPVAAVDLLRRAVAVKPAQGVFHANLGDALGAAGDANGAETAYREALRLAPDNAPAWCKLAETQLSAGRADEAAKSAARALALAPLAAEALTVQGQVEQARGNLDAAVRHFRAALEHAPRFLPALANLVTVLVAAGRPADAVESAERLCEMAPAAERAWRLLAESQRLAGDGVAAETAARRAVGLAPGVLEPLLALELIVRLQGRIEESVRCLRQALAIAPQRAATHNDLGKSLLALGDVDQARACFERAVELEPGLAEAWENLSRSHRYPPEDARQKAARVRELLAASAAGGSAATLRRASLAFAAGTLYAKAGEDDQAFDLHVEANACMQRLHAWDCERHSTLVTRLMGVFDAGFFAARTDNAAAGDADLPVLIVGMPRSGTTLVEQILASHSAVHGGGELNVLASLTEAIVPMLEAGPWPDCARALDEPKRADLAGVYLRHLRSLSPQALRVTDKLPSNFLHLGLLALVLPGARVLHCVRDAADTAVSVFFQHFERGHAWSHDLYAIGRYLADQERLMSHWRAVLPLRIHEVSYEQLVDRQEAVSRCLLEHCGLDWEDDCLRFFETRRVVRTASDLQVRQPVYSGSVGRARRYAHRMGDFERGLRDGRSGFAAGTP